MNKIETYIGYWFIPSENPKNWSGTLKISKENRIFLEFVTTEDEINNIAPEIFQQVHQINNQVPIPLINGYAKNSTTKKDIGLTLIDLELISFNRSGLITLTLEAKFCLNYYQVQRNDQLLFKTLMVKFDGFDIWMDKNGFVVEDDIDDPQFSTQVKFRQPESIELLKTELLDIHFFFRAKSPTFFITGNEALIQQSLYLNIDFENPQSLDELTFYNEKIQNFFSLINTYPTQRCDCQVKLYKDEDNSNSNIGDRTIDLIYEERVPNFSEHIKRSSALFLYSEVENQFKSFIENWFRLYKLYEPALDQYFDTMYFNQGHVISRFVNILSVLEIYHSRKFNKSINLKDKLKDLVSQLGVINSKYFKFSDEFVDEVILIRKFYVHGNKVISKLTEAMQRKETISIHVRSLENIFRIHLLLELGLNEDVLSKLIARKPWQWGVIDN